MTTVCHLWPSVSPHGPEVPTSIWNLQYGVWLGLAAAADQYIEQNRERG
jgi:hypothetical protein